MLEAKKKDLKKTQGSSRLLREVSGHSKIFFDLKSGNPEFLLIALAKTKLIQDKGSYKINLKKKYKKRKCYKKVIYVLLRM